MPETPLVGVSCKAYRNTGTNASPVLVEVPEIKDLSISSQSDSPEVSDRGSEWKKYYYGMRDLSLSFSINYRNGNANFEALRSAHFSNTPVQFYILDGASDVSGVQGLKAYFMVSGFDASQPLTEGVTYDLELKPTFFDEGGSSIHPDWHTVA